MGIQVDTTQWSCAFCARAGRTGTPVLRSMHGIYCSNEACYTRQTAGNLVPPSPCGRCGENSFYVEEAESPGNGAYLCIACGFRTETD